MTDDPDPCGDPRLYVPSTPDDPSSDSYPAEEKTFGCSPDDPDTWGGVPVGIVFMSSDEMTRMFEQLFGAGTPIVGVIRPY